MKEKITCGGGESALFIIFRIQKSNMLIVIVLNHCSLMFEENNQTGVMNQRNIIF